MKKISIIFILLGLAINIYAQNLESSKSVGCPPCVPESCSFQNPSFECMGQANCPNHSGGILPPYWNNCQTGKTPDEQPGTYGVTLPAKDGSSYVGFDNYLGWNEGASQQLCAPLIAGATYTFTMWLATIPSIAGNLLQGGNVGIKVYGNYGGSGGCDESYGALWTSPTITNYSAWQQYTCTFVAPAAFTYILFQGYQPAPNSTETYILLDDLSPITWGSLNVSVVPAAATICSGSSTTLTAYGGATNYTWSPSTGLNTTTGATVIANPTISTTYTVFGAVGLCTGSSSVTITVKPNPAVKVTANPAGYCCSIGPSTLTATGAPTYSWCCSLGTANPVIAHPTTATTYTVTGTQTNGCTSSAQVKIVSSFPSCCKIANTGEDNVISTDEENNNDITVFPNPTLDGSFTLNFNSDLEEHYLIKVIDLNGKEILSEKYIANSGKNSVPLNIKSLAKGCYILFINSSTNLKKTYIIKE